MDIQNQHESKLFQRLAEQIDGQGFCAPNRLNMSPEQASKGLVQLALTIVNLLKEIMEKQAMRRMDSGSLTDEEVERLGTTFMLLEEKMDELREVFGLSAEDLQLNLNNFLTIQE